MMKKLTSKIIFVLLSCMCLLCTCAYAAHADDTAVPVLLYHNIAEEVSGEDYDALLNISASLFEEHMSALKKAGYNTITYEQYYDYVTNGAPLPYKPILVTFDDGYSSNYLYAYPVLKKLDMKATIFVITDRRGMALSKNPHFSWNQAREMQDSGIIDIQSHTHSHQVATNLTDFDLFFELKTSKNLIENKLGKKCSVIAFPFGAANEREIEAAKRAGYLIVNKVGDQGVNRKEDGLYTLKRLTARADWTPTRLLEVIDENMNMR